MRNIHNYPSQFLRSFFTLLRLQEAIEGVPLLQGVLKRNPFYFVCQEAALKKIRVKKKLGLSWLKTGYGKHIKLYSLNIYSFWYVYHTSEVVLKNPSNTLILN